MHVPPQAEDTINNALFQNGTWEILEPQSEKEEDNFEREKTNYKPSFCELLPEDGPCSVNTLRSETIEDFGHLT